MTEGLPNRRLIPVEELPQFMAEYSSDIQRAGLTLSLVYPGSMYTHTSIDMQEDGHIRKTVAEVKEGMVYLDFSKEIKTDPA
jgi:hypothetical protein